MKKIFGLLTACIVCIGILPSDAQAVSFKTDWSFEARYLTPSQRYADHHSNYPDADITMIMPLGSTWTCKKPPASLRKDGMMISGFTCYSVSGNVVHIAAMCFQNKEDADTAAATVGNDPNVADNAVKFFVSCHTHK